MFKHGVNGVNSVDYRQVAKTLLRDETFAPQFYEVFFELSPRSKLRFNDFKKQKHVLAQVLDYMVVRHGAATEPAFVSKLKRTHEKMNISYEELYLFHKSCIIVMKIKCDAEDNVIDRILNNLTWSMARVQQYVLQPKDKSMPPVSLT